MYAENLLSAAFRKTVALVETAQCSPTSGSLSRKSWRYPSFGFRRFIVPAILTICLPAGKKKFCDGRPRLPVFSPTFPYPIHPLLMSFLGQRKKYLHSAVHGKQTGEIMYNIHALKPHHFFRVSYNIKYNTNTKDANEKGCLLKLITQPPPRYFLHVMQLYISRVLSIYILRLIPRLW